MEKPKNFALRLLPPVDAMEAQVEPFRSWIEGAIGCRREQAITFEFDFPFNNLVIEELLSGVNIDRSCCPHAEILRPLVRQWELPPCVSPRIELVLSRDKGQRVSDRTVAFDPHFKETPIAVWLNSAQHALVTMNIPYVSFLDKGAFTWKSWILVNPSEASLVLNTIAKIEPPKEICVIGGDDISLAGEKYAWDSVVLDPRLRLQEDYEGFFQRESWFVERNLPYKRGYLFFGPPGNGKSTTARIMACHPKVVPFSINLSAPELPNDALTHVFNAAAHKAPSLVILEDLDRTFGKDSSDSERTMTVGHLLQTLDGLQQRAGIVVVATANDPASLDPALLRRPGRFDRLVPFGTPTAELRETYLRRLTRLDDESVSLLARESDRLSFAQLREAVTVAGNMIPYGEGEIGAEQVLKAIRMVRSEANGVAFRGHGSIGFESSGTAAD